MRTETATITSDQSGPWSNASKFVLHTFYSDQLTLCCVISKIPLVGEEFYFSVKDKVSVFKEPSTGWSVNKG